MSAKYEGQLSRRGRRGDSNSSYLSALRPRKLDSASHLEAERHHNVDNSPIIHSTMYELREEGDFAKVQMVSSCWYFQDSMAIPERRSSPG